MMRFIHFPHRAHSSAADKSSLRLLFVAIVLGLFLALQIGLVLWVYLKQWRL